MIKNLFIFLIILFLPLYSFPQVTLTEEQYNNLPKSVKEQIELENTTERVTNAIGIGHEIGVAVNETLVAIEDSALRISESNIGKEAIF